MTYLFDPAKIERDDLGFFYHPDAPDGDEAIDIRPALAMMGFDAKTIPHSYEECFSAQGEWIGAKNWNPESPRPGNWLLAAIYDSEDGEGARALFVRKTSQRKQDALLGKFLIAETSAKQTEKMQKGRSSGKRGWWSEAQCSDTFIENLMRMALDDEDWISVANYAAMLDFRKTHGGLVK